MAGEARLLGPVRGVHDITMPEFGETVTEGTIGRWLEHAGDTVAFNDPLYEVSTDKVGSEIPARTTACMLEVLVQEGEPAPVGAVLARIGETVTAAGPGAERPRDVGARGPGGRVGRSCHLGHPVRRTTTSRMLSPLVRRLVAEAGLDVNAVTGSGAGGRIWREDVERAIAAAEGQARRRPPPACRSPRPRHLSASPRPGRR